MLTRFAAAVDDNMDLVNAQQGLVETFQAMLSASDSRLSIAQQAKTITGRIAAGLQDRPAFSQVRACLRYVPKHDADSRLAAVREACRTATAGPVALSRRPHRPYHSQGERGSSVWRLCVGSRDSRSGKGASLAPPMLRSC